MDGLEKKNGQVAFALRGAPAWHNLAERTFGEEEHVSTQQMLDGALLSGWDVRLEEVPVPDGVTDDKTWFQVLRNNPFTTGEVNRLAIVGERYRTYQNEDLFAFGDNILEGGGYWESAGSIKGGRVVFGSLKLDRELVLDPNGANDKTETYLLVVTSHDGSSSIQVMTTPVRVVCQNTLNMALNGCKQSFKVRHTQSASGRVDEARQALNLSFKYLDRFEEQAQELFASSITDKQFHDIVKALYPAPADDAKSAVLTKYENKIDLINGLYFDSPTQDNIRGTAWGALNALTERVDYFRDGRAVKGSDPVKNLSASASGFDAQANAEKGRILSAVKELVLA
jgi:phage/plasmid-like protein (TIGR03299 family)